MSAPEPIIPTDERFHRVDPGQWSWNESWFFSWIDLTPGLPGARPHDGGPAGFFRVGVLPNQQRAMLWAFVHVDGQWLAVEESRLAFDDLDLEAGVAYDKWALAFAWQPDPPLHGARFTFAGEALVRSGPNAGAYVPISIDLACRAAGPCVRTTSGADGHKTAYDASRFEQCLEATGSVVVGGQRHEVHAGAHRDRSWGPREWRQLFTLGDLQAPGRQLYFVGRTFPGLGMGFLRDDPEPIRHLVVVDGSIDFDDEARTIRSASLRLEGGEAQALEVTMRPIADSVAFDMAHTCESPEHWLYWRTLVEAEVSGWDEPCRGWFETNRYGIA